MRGAGARATAALAAGLVVSLAACSGGTDTIERTGSAATSGFSDAAPPSSGGSSAVPSGGSPAAYAVADPGPLRSRLYPADLLVTSSKPIPARVRTAVAGTRGVEAVIPLSLASLSSNGRTLTIAAADPGQFRRFTAYPTASANAVWKRVAGGEVAVDPGLSRRLEEPRGYLRLGTTDDSPTVHIGAYAPIVKQISAVVNYKRGEQLGVPRDNALLVSTGAFTPSAVTPRLKRLLPPGTSMQTLAIEFDTDVQTAVLSGTSVSEKVGTFSYTPHPDGTLTPDSSWVRSFIRTEQVPILGSVTCNKGMLPQLRAALAAVVQRGLADKIHPGEYAGCYYPRYIARDPAKGLSLHSWGIAVDLNVPGNQRGTVGEMDREVVAIFKRWGFAWGGDWNYTDPMHFEMAQVVGVR
jgi:hypothetical protein